MARRKRKHMHSGSKKAERGLRRKGGHGRGKHESHKASRKHGRKGSRKSKRG